MRQKSIVNVVIAVLASTGAMQRTLSVPDKYPKKYEYYEGNSFNREQELDGRYFESEGYPRGRQILRSNMAYEGPRHRRGYYYEYDEAEDPNNFGSSDISSSRYEFGLPDDADSLSGNVGTNIPPSSSSSTTSSSSSSSLSSNSIDEVQVSSNRFVDRSIVAPPFDL